MALQMVDNYEYIYFIDKLQKDNKNTCFVLVIIQLLI